MGFHLPPPPTHPTTHPPIPSQPPTIAERERERAHRACFHLPLNCHNCPGRKQATIILKIFVGTLRPCLEDVEEWLSNATLPSTHQEFFIRQGAFWCFNRSSKVTVVLLVCHQTLEMMAALALFGMCASAIQSCR